MQCGSTGLGSMALKMKLADESQMTKLPPTKPPEGSLIMYCKTYDPVVWCVWIGIEPEDMGALMRLVFKKETLVFACKFLIRSLSSGFKGLFSRKKSVQEAAPVDAKEEKGRAT